MLSLCYTVVSASSISKFILEISKGNICLFKKIIIYYNQSLNKKTYYYNNYACNYKKLYLTSINNLKLNCNGDTSIRKVAGQLGLCA